MKELESKIRSFKDFPKTDVNFYDISPVIGDASIFAETVGNLAAPLEGEVDKVIAFDARGFIFGGAMATHLKVGLAILRKSGKLPGETLEETYDLEYGKNTLEVQSDVINPGERVALVDDVIATGGTALAGINLVRQCGAKVTEFCSVIDLPELGGSEKIKAAGVAVRSLVSLEA